MARSHFSRALADRQSDPAGRRWLFVPYLCGAAFIDRMSDFCAGCSFDPKRDCPISNLYWAFLDRQRGRLESNPRMRVVMNALSARPSARLDADGSIHRWVAETLGRGEVLWPEERPGGQPG